MSPRLLVVLLVTLVLSSCTATSRSAEAPSSPATPASSPSDPATTVSAGPLPGDVVHTSDPYVGLAAMLHARHVRIWWETDLVARWLQGPAAFAQGVDRLRSLAHVPGTVGFKVADELGYNDGLQSPDDVRRFLTDVRTALRQAAPGKRILVDAIVPELGCLPWRGPSTASCTQSARADYPADTVDAVTSYLKAGLIDDLDLSTGLLDPSYYAERGLSVAGAQREAWAHVVDWGWPGLTSLRARKALAEPGGYQGTVAEAADEMQQYVHVPVVAGAAAVDIWTWRQPYEGATVSLLAPGLGPNPLWSALQRERSSGVRLFTHMTPSQMPSSPQAFAHECDLAASVFTDVFVAAGTG